MRLNSLPVTSLEAVNDQSEPPRRERGDEKYRDPPYLHDSSLLQRVQQHISAETGSVLWGVAFAFERGAFFEGAANVVGRKNHGDAAVDFETFEERSRLVEFGRQRIGVGANLWVAKLDAGQAEAVEFVGEDGVGGR